jgi:ElaB/YqjD/DUF883 family membrane-anchored ribosome-binding protein
MSQNRPDNDKATTGDGGTSAGATGDPSQWGSKGATDAGGAGLTTTGGTTSGGAATGTATGLAAQAKEYGQKATEAVTSAATQAKDYLSDKATVVGDKLQDLRNVDYGQLAEDAKQYARQKPGQALLISAAAGFVIGLLLRGSRR